MIEMKVFRYTIEVHFSFFLLVGLGIYFGSGIFVISSVLFSFLHELVHGFVAKKLGYHAEKISFGLFGGVIHIREGFLNPKDELFIHLSGPLFNLLIATFFYFSLKLWGEDLYSLIIFGEPFAELLIFPILYANLILGIFNLLPFYPLDGGKVIGLYLAFFFGYGKAEKISGGFSLLFAIFLFFLGIYLVQYNIMNLIISALAINLFIAARQAKSFIFYKVSKDIEKGCKEKEGNRQIIVYREKQKAMKVIDSYKPWDNNIFTIVNDRGYYKGQISEEELLNGIYECGIYADFGKLLDSKKLKKGRN